MKNLILSLVLLLLSQPSWARKPQEDCGLVSIQAATYMQERQAGKKRKAMTFSTQGVWPGRLKQLYREIIVDAHREPMVKNEQVQQMVVNSFQEKWYRECVRRST